MSDDTDDTDGNNGGNDESADHAAGIWRWLETS